LYIEKIDRTYFEEVKRITVNTIKNIYPHYYPDGAVNFFLEHHNDENILNDIECDRVYICFDSENTVAGTVTIKDNEICRLFVLPEYQGRGYGRELLDFSEKKIFENYDAVTLSASFPAKAIYLKRGYVETEYSYIRTDNGDYLCFDTMIKVAVDKIKNF